MSVRFPGLFSGECSKVAGKLRSLGGRQPQNLLTLRTSVVLLGRTAASRHRLSCISRGLSGRHAVVRLTLLSARCLSSCLFFHTDLETSMPAAPLSRGRLALLCAVYIPLHQN